MSFECDGPGSARSMSFQLFYATNGPAGRSNFRKISAGNAK